MKMLIRGIARTIRDNLPDFIIARTIFCALIVYPLTMIVFIFLIAFYLIIAILFVVIALAVLGLSLPFLFVGGVSALIYTSVNDLIITRTLEKMLKKIHSGNGYQALDVYQVDENFDDFIYRCMNIYGMKEREIYVLTYVNNSTAGSIISNYMYGKKLKEYAKNLGHVTVLVENKEGLVVHE